MDENWDLWKLESKLEHRRVWLLLSLAIAFLMSTLGCTVERRKTDAELGLTAQQAAGRRVYDDRCDRCHEPYSTRGKKGPSLKGIFKRPYMPESGLPANDERATDIIRYGRSKMPGFSEVLTQEQIDELLAYMHTL
jgi:mono/diheme cytochrome c family protein